MFQYFELKEADPHATQNKFVELQATLIYWQWLWISEIHLKLVFLVRNNKAEGKLTHQVTQTEILAKLKLPL